MPLQTDLVDDPVRRMSINRWMDHFLNNVGQKPAGKIEFREFSGDETLTLTEIGADHRGDQPQVQGRGGGGGRRRRSRLEHQVHLQPGE